MGVGVGGVAPLSFFKFVGILTKCVSKISRPNVVGKFGLFYHKKKKKCRILSKSIPTEIILLPVMMAFIKKSYKICTDNYDNNEYLVVKYIRFFTNNII